MIRLNRIPTGTIKAILADNYTRGKDGKDYEQYRDELERILWKRQEAKLGRIQARRELEVARELRGFKTQFRMLTDDLFINGDSLELRERIIECINEYSLFREYNG